jgi:DNA-binding transcriptional LysR family regulator
MRINYDFNDLEAFLAVKQTGSFQVAAERLNLSQSAVTRRIKKLEAALDTVLFERTTRAVKPTLAAKRLEARAEVLIENAQETTRAMRDESAAFAYQKNAIVTVAILPSVAPLVLTKALRRFRADDTQARVRILDRSANEVAESVAQGEADFGICSMPMLEPSTTFEHLFEDKIGIAMLADHPFAQRGCVAWSDLSDETVIVPSQGTGNRVLIDEALARNGQPIAWTYEVARSTTAVELVAADIGIALLPRSSVASFIGQSIVMRPIGDPEIARPVGIISRIGSKDHPAVTAFKSAIRAVIQDR